MNKLYQLFKVNFLMMFIVGLFACSTAPYTGRNQLLLISPSEENKLGLTAYEEVLKKEKVSTNPEYNRLVTNVGRRIANAAERPDFQWEFKVIESDQINAFCLPGGKIVVYTGILPVTKSEAGLAAVVGHEVAHALARHSGERLSQGLVSQGVLLSTDMLLSTKGAGANRQSIMAALGLGTQVGVLLPFSRAQESEADHIGVILMAKAGYDPHESVELWKRMKASSKGKKPPEFLSTHPADDTRIKQLENWLPEAMTYYHGAGK